MCIAHEKWTTSTLVGVLRHVRTIFSNLISNPIFYTTKVGGKIIDLSLISLDKTNGFIEEIPFLSRKNTIGSISELRRSWKLIFTGFEVLDSTTKLPNMSLQRLLNLEIALMVFFTTHAHFTKESLIISSLKGFPKKLMQNYVFDINFSDRKN